VVQRKTQNAPLAAEQIVETALRIADADGLAELSMRRVAGELGVTAMALYRHVGSKDQLIDLIAAHALSAVPEPDPAGDWTREMLRFFSATHDLLLQHPAVAHIMSQRPLAGERTTKLADLALETLIAAGFSDDLAVELFLALGSYALGGSLYQVGRTRWAGAEPPARFEGLSAVEHPTLSRLAKSMGRAGSDEIFVGGLQSLIDSYAEQLRAQRRWQQRAAI